MFKVCAQKHSPSFFSKTQANQIHNIRWYEMKPELEEFKIVLVCGRNHEADINDVRAGVEFCCYFSILVQFSYVLNVSNFVKVTK